MALPNAFRPSIPEPARSDTTPAALPIHGKMPERTADRPVSSSSDTGKDKFKAILQKKTNPELTDGTSELVDDATDEVSDSTTAPTTSPFDLAAESRVQKGKGKIFPFSDVGERITEAVLPVAKETTSFADADATALINAGEEAGKATPTTLSKTLSDTSTDSTITSLEEESALLEKGSEVEGAPINPLLPSAGSIASEDDIKNLQLFTREDILKAFSSWENKKKSANAQGLAVGAQTIDASQVQAQIAGIAQIDAPTQKSGADELTKARDARATTIQLVDQLVKALSQLTQTDRTETTLTLKYPPIFEGVSITITEFKTAQKEFNVTFFNLTNPTARLLIETKQNQESLRNALIEKGYTLQMITIEPKLDISTSTSTTSDSKRQGQQGRREEQGGHPQGGFGAGTG